MAIGLDNTDLIRVTKIQFKVEKQPLKIWKNIIAISLKQGLQWKLLNIISHLIWFYLKVPFTKDYKKIIGYCYHF